MNPAKWFLDNGIRIFPIKPRDKVPACASWDDYRATPEEVATWINYGVCLGLLGVIDSDSPEVEAWVSQHAPQTPFVVKTARGLHRYYQLIGATTHFIHRAGHTIEFRNHGQYVVGPGSVHSSGFVYAAEKWSWQIRDVPFFPVNDFHWDDRSIEHRGSADGQPLILPPAIHAGERHDLLFKLMRSLQARGVADVEQILTILKAENKAKCVPPLDEGELTRYIRRVARYKDRPEFTRQEILDPEESGAELAGELIEIGVSPAAAVEAAKAIDVKFDPTGAAPSNEKRLKAEKKIARLEARLAKEKANLDAVEHPLDDDSDVIDWPEADDDEVHDASELIGGVDDVEEIE